MWNEIIDALELHDTALLTGFDDQQFPFSVRCVPVVDWNQKRLIVQIPDEARIVPGKASLLMHSHDEELWTLVQFLIRGTLVRTTEGYYFVPASISGSPRPQSTIEGFRNLRAMRSRANAYLSRRGEPRPKVPWDDIKRLQERAEAWREARARERDA